MEEKIEAIKRWLGAGSINIFGLPMSGKDTVGRRLAETIGGKFLSSGEIIRAVEKESTKSLTSDGQLAPTDVFYELVLPYFGREDLKQFPLILSSVGRWSGEEKEVMKVAQESGHEIKAAVILNISEADVMNRWEAAKVLNDRGERDDDLSREIFQKRIHEFREKTLPVIQTYQSFGILISVKADLTREEVFGELVGNLYKLSLRNQPSMLNE